MYNLCPLPSCESWYPRVFIFRDWLMIHGCQVNETSTYTSGEVGLRVLEANIAHFIIVAWISFSLIVHTRFYSILIYLAYDIQIKRDARDIWYAPSRKHTPQANRYESDLIQFQSYPAPSTMLGIRSRQLSHYVHAHECIYRSDLQVRTTNTVLDFDVHISAYPLDLCACFHIDKIDLVRSKKLYCVKFYSQRAGISE